MRCRPYASALQGLWSCATRSTKASASSCRPPRPWATPPVILSQMDIVLKCVSWFPAGAVELRNALNAAFAIELPATAIMDYPTVEALTSHVVTVVAPLSGRLTGVMQQFTCIADMTSLMLQLCPQS